ncbi:hypothetical protein K9B35_05945 [Sphingomonas sp. R647]|uniref:hypothetical protein n=1 Tax=Sphingomonas sp. R647 TaxID=2875233 RepID=UPI001CD3A04F|nr:hypothetical protein [Sphingomonas sp. R647]MCA1197499.1 hypothetical protein [Sphingomonas sp. R647]
MVSDPWHVLGIAPTDDVRAVRRAYAARLKSIEIDTDPEGYAALRLARDAALRLANGQGDGGDRLDGADQSGPQSEGELRLRVNPFHAPAIMAPAQGGGWLSLGTIALPADPIMWRWSEVIGRSDDGVDATIPIPDRATLKPPRLDAHVAQTIMAFGAIAGSEPEFDHFEAIIAILFQDGVRRDTMPSADEERMLLEHFDGIQHGRRIGEMNYYADVERWCADIIAHGAPASNCLMAPAAAFFRWRERAGELGEGEAVAFINRRLKVFEFIETVSKPEHPWNKAWTELTTYAHEHSRRGWGVKRQHVRELLEHVRSENPDLEQHFDGTRVALWETKREWGSFPWVQIVVGGFLLLSVLGKCSQEMSRSPLPPSEVAGPGYIAPDLTQQRFQIDNALRARGYTDLTLAVAEQENPELAQMLKSNWIVVAEEGRGMGSFEDRLAAALSERLVMAIRGGGYEDVADYQRNRVAWAQAYRERGVVLCDDYLQRGDTPPVAGRVEFQRREREIEERVLRTAKAPFAPGGSEVTIPGEIVADVLTRTRLPEARVRASMRGDGDATDRCAVRIALLDAVLRMPRKQGLPILRAL